MVVSAFIELALTHPKDREDSEKPAIITIVQLVEVVHLEWSFQASWADLNLILLTFSLSFLILLPHLQMMNLTENLPKSSPPH